MKKLVRIDRLTDAQKAQMAPWAEKWIEIGLRTGEMDYESFVAGISAAYGFAGLAWHGNVVRVSSPLALALAAPVADYLIRKYKQPECRTTAMVSAVDDAVDGAVGGAVRVAVGDAVGGAVGVAVRGAVRDAVRDAVDGAVGGAVRVAVGGAVRVAVDDAVRAYIKNNWYNYLGGQFLVGGWYYGNAYVTFFRDICHLQLSADISARMSAYEQINTSACWSYPARDFVMVCERPAFIHLEKTANSHRLHCATGPSIAWPDGWSLYHWHGTAIPGDWIIKPESLDAKTALNWPNIEQRRAAAEIIGWAKILDAMNAEVIDADPNPQVGTLLEVDLPDSGKERFLRVKCGTGRDFVLGVPRSTETALEANLRTYRLSGGRDLLPEVRT
jgi:Domain of unknown function (DUF6745)